ncbi:hypothetical protein E1176_06170 [Fulvivirga sp. RKSG066]|uniref:hypothetical protein n=1 Tax=Fulvivirga aurantia TaxID=2529383 RepID=UPI0012BC8DEC|nr:hypothetical protein [Fulvivirga aurantia]MTI20600.1 hypothetical protein [Fulvivirga aurantia]
MSKYSFICIEGDGHGFGHILGAYSDHKQAVEAIKAYYETPVVFLDEEPADYEAVAVELNRQDGGNCFLSARPDENSNGVMIFKLKENKNYF